MLSAGDPVAAALLVVGVGVGLEMEKLADLGRTGLFAREVLGGAAE